MIRDIGVLSLQLLNREISDEEYRNRVIALIDAMSHNETVHLAVVFANYGYEQGH